MPYLRPRHLLVAVVAPALLGACATKGWVRKEMTRQAVTTDSLVGAERMARIQGDSLNAQQIAQLRTDLDSLRNQFGARIAMLEDGLHFALPVNFAFDDANVRDADRPGIQRFASVAQKYYPGSTITVEGFADPAGSARYNLALSQRRAENVRALLASEGLSDAQIRAVGYGKTRLVVPGAQKDEPGAEQNRRVVFVIESNGQAPGVASLDSAAPGLAQVTP